MNWIAQELEKWIPEAKCPLIYQDAFSLLVAVMLSAQCTDKRVNLITPALMADAPTPEKMLNLGEEKILFHIRSLGLAQRKAHSLVELSRQILTEFNGEVPQKLEDLMKLSGVGRKTALVVTGELFGQNTFPVDTHIARLAGRWKISSSKNVEKIERDLMHFFPDENWHDLHLRMILYARQYCTARGCDGTICPICSKINQSH